MRRLNRTDAFILFFLSVLFIYFFIRAVLVDITNDEAYSFYIVKNFWYAEALCTGNTHWLNSLAIKLSVLCGLEETGQIRWFSTLSAFLIFMLTFAWIKSFKEVYLKVFICTLILNPYIMDYLGLARGYAPGLMFQCAALYFFISRFKEKAPPSNFPALFFAGLSALSNFSFVYFFVAFSLAYYSFVYFKDLAKAFKSPAFYRDSAFIFGLLALVIRAFAFMSNCSNDVIGAGTESFSEYFEVIFKGLIPSFKMNSETTSLFSYTVCGILVISGLTGILSRNASENKAYHFSSVILLIMLSATFINGFFFGIVFPYFRSAIFLFPTSLICFVYLLDKIVRSQILRRIIFYGSGSLLTLNFILSLNLTSVLDYHSQANSKESLNYLKSIHAKNVAMSAELYGVFRNYYEVKENRDYTFSGEMIARKNPGKENFNKQIKDFDYLLLVPPYDLDFKKDPEVKVSAVKYFPETGTLILKVN